MNEKASVTALKRTDLGMVFQQFNLFLTKTALGNVTAPLRDVKRMPKEAAGQHALENLRKVAGPEGQPPVQALRRPEARHDLRPPQAFRPCRRAPHARQGGQHGVNW
ncbi:hypothetical protein [Arthrobacter sp. TMS1-12-1]